MQASAKNRCSYVEGIELIRGVIVALAKGAFPVVQALSSGDQCQGQADNAKWE